MCIRDRTYTVEQRITEGESSKTVRSAYQVTVYVDSSGNLTIIQNPTTVSYTHLDVYKRQVCISFEKCRRLF